MNRNLILTMSMMLGLTASAQSVLDTDFESGEIPSAWTQTKPASPYKGGYSVVTYASQSALKATNVGTNNLGGIYVLLSKTGGLNNYSVKGNSDNWLTSPEVTIGTDNIFSFRLAANCSYSPIVEDAEKMKMDIVVIDGDNKTVIGTITPENYFTWKQYAYDLSAYNGKTIKIAFHDYGTAGASAVADMKYIDNIKLSAERLSDYAIEEVEPIHGQALYTQPYIIKVTNYGISAGSFTANYSYGTTTVSETVNSDIASGQSVEYTFQHVPSFAPGDTVVMKTRITAMNDAMEANDSLADTYIISCPIQSLPYSLCNKIDTLTDLETGKITSIEVTGDEIINEFSANKYGKNYSYFNYMTKYHAWIYSHTKEDISYPGYNGVIYLYTNKAFSLPAGKLYLQTIGNATLTDMKYEVYIAQYGGRDMVDYATKVGESETLRDAPNTGGGLDITTVELNIPEAGNYVVAIRPLTQLKNSQLAICGYSLSTTTPTGITEVTTDSQRSNTTACYNLAGQRVKENAHGIIISGGKKFIKR